MEEMKSDLSLAISNRTLALIEFKLMNASEDAQMHSELLDIHTENSLKYMSSAETHMKTLEELPAEDDTVRSEEHTSELQSRFELVCRLLLEKKNKKENEVRHSQ